MYGDQAYRGQKEVIREHAPNAKDFTNQRYRHRGVVDEVERGKNRTKSRVRAKVEHPFRVIKRVFGFAKVRYRGIARTARYSRSWRSPISTSSAADLRPQHEGGGFGAPRLSRRRANPSEKAVPVATDETRADPAIQRFPKNRLEGNAGFLTVTIPLGGPARPAPLK